MPSHGQCAGQPSDWRPCPARLALGLTPSHVAPQWVRLLDVEDATEIEAGLCDARVVVVPGRLCHPRAADPAFKCPYVRIAFAHPPAEQLKEGVRRLASVLRERRRSLRQEQPPSSGM